ncbi:MAG: two-component regulator propeller domain-containing protein [Bacteroidota bacterium]
MLTIRMGLCLLGICWTLVVGSQTLQPTIHHFTTEQQLPSMEVYLTLQDSKGYLWFATDRGAVRYDGYHMQTFSTKNGLCDNVVLGIYEDHRGRIWFFTLSNQLSYYENGTVHDFPANAQLKEAIGVNIINNLSVDHQGTVWLGLKTRSDFIYITADGQLGCFQIDPVERYPETQSVPPLPRALLKTFRGTNRGTDEVLTFNTIRHLLAPQAPPPPELDPPLSAAQDSACLFAIDQCLYRATARGTEQLRCFEQPLTYGLLEDRDGNIWVADFGKGVRVYSPGNMDQARYFLLEEQVVSWITQDEEGGIWLSTLNDGIFYLPSIDFGGIQTADFFDAHLIRDIDRTGSSILLGTYQGLTAKIDYGPHLDLSVQTFTAGAHESRVFGLNEPPLSHLSLADERTFLHSTTAPPQPIPGRSFRQ